MNPTRLGAEFRALRTERGLSLAEVAEATGVSASFLSLFETGKNDITFARLVRLVNFYRVSIADLIPDPDPDHTTVVRARSRRRLESGSEHAAIELLTHDTRHKLLPVLVTLEPDGTIDQAGPPPGREVFIFLLRGRLEINDADATIRLSKGDSAYLTDERPRAYRNPGRTRAEWLAVTTPPAL